MMMRLISRKVGFVCLLFIFTIPAVQAQNPISPPGVYFADPSARVWNDGKLYLYGSIDENCSQYCSHNYRVLYTTNMKEWMLSPVSFSSKDKYDAVSYNDKVLYAPDCSYKNDTFYLYYCQPDKQYAEGVATSDNPRGPFKKGEKMDLFGHNQIDPAVFVDDDGEIYYLWGQFTLKMARLKSNMRELDSTSLVTDVLTEEAHFFHEGAYLTKRNGIYYMVYADISRADMPTCIGYATSEHPFGPYEYRGVIIDNDHCNPGNWNNHGSIAKFNGQWYVFYHRSTHGCQTMRQACVEPITFLADGSIPEVEMTSQGASGPLNARKKIEAEQACLLRGDLWVEENRLTSVRSGDRAAYKYIDFENGIDSLTLRIAPGKTGSKMLIYLDQPWHQRIASIDLEPAPAEEWVEKSFAVKPVQGVHAVWFMFYGEEKDQELLEMDWFYFQ